MIKIKSLVRLLSSCCKIASLFGRTIIQVWIIGAFGNEWKIKAKEHVFEVLSPGKMNLSIRRCFSSVQVMFWAFWSDWTISPVWNIMNCSWKQSASIFKKDLIFWGSKVNLHFLYFFSGKELRPDLSTAFIWFSKIHYFISFANLNIPRAKRWRINQNEKNEK